MFNILDSNELIAGAMLFNCKYSWLVLFCGISWIDEIAHIFNIMMLMKSNV